MNDEFKEARDEFFPEAEFREKNMLMEWGWAIDGANWAYSWCLRREIGPAEVKKSIELHKKLEIAVEALEKISNLNGGYGPHHPIAEKALSKIRGEE